ncbi:MAG: hypothetical protein A2Z34_05810 [Planctomycetes bacterium RBG_16_59_8]|nr:MAG: hypothetical protein A2Z34_05810 [Planctomycetes bacterium RBG_16_59_8]
MLIEARGDEPWFLSLIKRMREDPETRGVALIAVADEGALPSGGGIHRNLPKGLSVDEWAKQLTSLIGPVRKRPIPASPRLLALVAALGLLAVAAVILMFALPQRETTPPIPPGELADWKTQEEMMETNKLLFHEGSWFARPFLGEGVHLTLADGRKLEGFARQEKEGVFLRGMNDAQLIKLSDIRQREPKRQPYEEYWEQAARLSEGDAEGHIRLAQWCLEHGLKLAAKREYRRALIADPNHAEARRGYDRNR